MVRPLIRFAQDWWFRGAAALLAGMTVGLVGGEATNSVRSLPWTILLIASSVAASAWVLRIMAGARRRRDDRHEGLRRLREMGERLAIYDRETGLFAYWYFGLRLEEEVARCARYGQTFSLLLLEAQTGRWAPDDESALFRHMSDSFRSSDLVAHLGNLRFVVLLANTDAQGAIVVREHLMADEELGDLAVGVASFPDDGESCEAILTAVGASADDVEGGMRMTSSMRTDRQGLAGDSEGDTSAAA
ncbi:MAG: GGDEF domain-containing protein [Chloroflexi bacterium]|nr:GGDEF domain-containing protein [Chloroflexota bacterium]